MKIDDMISKEMTEGLAYLIGLIFPFLKDKEEIKDRSRGRKYVGGCINHNSVTDEDLAAHFQSIVALFAKCDCDVCIKNNAKELVDGKDFSCSNKKGFSCLIETTGVEIDVTEEILKSRVLEIEKSPLELKRFFVRACFDGRGSWDSTFHMFSVDIDRKMQNKDQRRDQFILKNICDSVIGKDSIQLNQRAWEHKKHDQMRIRTDFLRIFLDEVGLFSIARQNILEYGLNCIGR